MLALPSRWLLMAGWQLHLRLNCHRMPTVPATPSPGHHGGDQPDGSRDVADLTELIAESQLAIMIRVQRACDEEKRTRWASKVPR